MTASSSSGSSRISLHSSRRRRVRDSLVHDPDHPSCPHTSSSICSCGSNMADPHSSVEQQCDRVIFREDSDSLVDSSDSSGRLSTNHSTKVPHSYQQKHSLTTVLKSLLLLVLVILIVNFPAAGKKKKKFKLLQPFELVLKVDGHQQNIGRDFMLRDVAK